MAYLLVLGLLLVASVQGELTSTHSKRGFLPDLEDIFGGCECSPTVNCPDPEEYEEFTEDLAKVKDKLLQVSEELERNAEEVAEYRSEMSARVDGITSALNTLAEQIAAIRPPPPPPPGAGCPSDFTHSWRAGICFKILNEDNTWQGASDHCESLGSGYRLAVVDTQAKSDAVGDSLESDFGSSPSAIWINARQRGGEWQWVPTGEEVRYSLWRGGEPSGDGDCALLSPEFPGYSRGFNDNFCGFDWHWSVCEKVI